VEVSELVRLELERHDWAALRCGCGGTAEHVPVMFATILEADTPGDMIGYTLDNHLEIQTNLFECAVPAVGVILAALAGEHSPLARSHFMMVLWWLVIGDPHHSEAARGAVDLDDRCRAKAREGLWIILRTGLEGSADDAETAADICEAIDPDEPRLAFYRARLSERAENKTKRRRQRIT
jgi:hypothetical protein